MTNMKAGILTLVMLVAANSQVTLAQSAMYVNPDGDVGVGTDTPDHVLDVERFATEPSIAIHNTGSNGGATYQMIDDLSGANFKFKATQYGGFKIRDHGNVQDVITIAPQFASKHAIYIDTNGNVGVGATTQSVATELSVNGTVEAKGYIETNSSTSWPDYVFKKNYDLRPLEEIEEFTQINKHLPGVPSETEIATSGINIGEITVIQMEKIEELTLYMIALQKQNKALSDRVRFLEENL